MEQMTLPISACGQQELRIFPKNPRLHQVYVELAAALSCPPGELVFGVGAEDSKVLLIGEAPGRDEVREGRPFVGKAGQNLEELLSETGISRQDLFITNTVKFRPTAPGARGGVKNRPPTKQEVEVCARCLREELAILQPRLVVTLGNTALRAVTGEPLSIGDVHGRELVYPWGLLFPLYHPASIIYRRELKEVYRADMAILRQKYSDLLAKG